MIAFYFATGNTARMRVLDCGIIEVGRVADFVIMDKAQHSAGKNILDSVQLGDLPGVGMTIIDGIVRTQRSRNTPPATTSYKFVQTRLGTEFSPFWNESIAAFTTAGNRPRCG